MHQKVAVLVRGFFSQKADNIVTVSHKRVSQAKLISRLVVISLKKPFFKTFLFCFQQKSSVLKALPKSFKFCMFLRSLSNDYSCSVLTSRGTTLENWSGLGKSNKTSTDYEMQKY